VRTEDPYVRHISSWCVVRGAWCQRRDSPWLVACCKINLPPLRGGPGVGVLGVALARRPESNHAPHLPHWERHGRHAACGLVEAPCPAFDFLQEGPGEQRDGKSRLRCRCCGGVPKSFREREMAVHDRYGTKPQLNTYGCRKLAVVESSHKWRSRRRH